MELKPEFYWWENALELQQINQLNFQQFGTTIIELQPINQQLQNLSNEGANLISNNFKMHKSSRN